jgi:hypothetical protein
MDATPGQVECVERELPRFTQAGAWEASTCDHSVSRVFKVPKPGKNQWRLNCYLRPLNKFFVRKRLNIETLLRVKHLTRKGEYMFNFDLQDGFYALGINPSYPNYFIVDMRGQLYRLSS